MNLQAVKRTVGLNCAYFGHVFNKSTAHRIGDEQEHNWCGRIHLPYRCQQPELPPLKWSSLKYDFVGGLFDGEEAYG